MDHFEYVMVLVSIIIGLAITHLLTAMGSAIHRLRGHGAEIRLEPVYLCWVAFMFVWLVSFWWWEYKFSQLDVEWSIGLYLFVVLYAVIIFLTTVILVPPKMESVSDSYTYFLKGRKWFFSFLLLLFVFDIADTVLKGSGWVLRPVYLALMLFFFAACFVGMATQHRKPQLISAALVLVLQLSYIFAEIATLGEW